MKSYIQLIGSGTFDVPPSIMIHFDSQQNSQRYLFNCGEGTQRFCLQNKLKVTLPLKRANDSTLDTVDNTSLQYKKEILSLMFNQHHQPHNPKGQKKSKTYEENSALDIPDDVQNDQSSSSKDDKDSLIQQRRKLFPKRLPKSCPSSTSIAYVCIGPEYKGKFNPEAAKALGLKPGRQYVTAPDGTTVHPNQVLGPSRAGT
ncbi:17021_t:CDS:2, partial [Racocetra fulgida]